MKMVYFRVIWRLVALCASFLVGFQAVADPRHGLSMYGEPALPPDFVSLPYVNPAAPKGGSITLGNTGGFDSLNPFVRKGTVPWQLSVFTHESLMGRSQDEAFTLYGLLAESVEVPEDRSWVEYTLRPEARFSDGSFVTVEDVIFSFKLLGEEGHPRYAGLWAQIEAIEATGPRRVRITFNTDNREMALLSGLRPILSRAQWQGRDFANAPLEEIPIGSGPYVVTDYEGGRYVELTRNKDYWGKNVPFRRGTHNFDQIRLDFYGDASVLFEAFKAGEVSAVREFNADTWARQYDFPAAARGDVVKSEISHKKPSGMTGFVMNTRHSMFSDWRVRQAMIEAFNFEYINDTITGGAQPRITSYFSNSHLAMQPGAAPPAIQALLAPFSAELPPGALDGYELPKGDGTARNRAGLQRAASLLTQAGWAVGTDGLRRNRDEVPFEFTLLMPKGSSENIAIAEIYQQGLKRLGITMTVDAIDDAQYTERTNSFDFDMTVFRRSVSLSPGTEQRFYWGSLSADLPGSRNLMGLSSPAVDTMIDKMLEARTTQDMTNATRALDRLLMAGRYVIPFWSYTTDRIAHIRQMQRPDAVPLYGDGPNYMPEVWWYDPDGK